jgi:L-amino acid N-acyltransferase YncA
MTRIRDAGPDDVEAITALTNALIATTTIEWRDEPYALDDRRRWLAAKLEAGYPVLVAEADGAVVGWATGSRSSTPSTCARTTGAGARAGPCSTPWPPGRGRPASG